MCPEKEWVTEAEEHLRRVVAELRIENEILWTMIEQFEADIKNLRRDAA